MSCSCLKKVMHFLSHIRNCTNTKNVLLGFINAGEKKIKFNIAIKRHIVYPALFDNKNTKVFFFSHAIVLLSLFTHTTRQSEASKIPPRGLYKVSLKPTTSKWHCSAGIGYAKKGKLKGRLMKNALGTFEFAISIGDRCKAAAASSLYQREHMWRMDDTHTFANTT